MKRYIGYGMALTLVAVTGLYFWYQMRLPQRTGTEFLPKLAAPVEVSFDDWGIPHIFAKNPKDAYLSMGYLHAQDRLFQMELYRRIAQGRLAEIFGPEAIKADEYFLTIGTHEIARTQYRKMDQQSTIFKLAQAYVDGINAFIAKDRLPPEFALLGIKPRPFSVLDSLSILNYMGTTFGSGLKTDLMLTAIREKVGSQMVSELNFAPKPARAQLSRSKNFSIPTELLAQLDRIEDYMDRAGRFHGSNAWLIPGELTRSGAPILANDTHIRYANPPVWYEAQLSYPGTSIYGSFLAGSPFPLLGRTRDYAWGITIFLSDTLDVVADKKVPGTPLAIERGGKRLTLTRRQSLIPVRGEDPREFEVLTSDIGPIINGVFPDLTPSDQYLSLYSTLMSPDTNPLQNLYQIAQADTREKFISAARSTRAPSLNLFYAHKTEGTAWVGAGQIRELSQDLSEYFIQDGASFAPRFLAFSQQPQLVNPPEKIIANSNHHPLINGVSYSGYYPYPSRIKRLEELLQGGDWTIERLKQVQTDTVVAYKENFETLIPLMLPELDPHHTKLATLLKSWLGNASHSSVQPTIFYEWLGFLVQNISHNHLGKELGEHFSKSYAALRSLIQLLELPDSKWWDDPKTPETESRNQALSRAFKQAINNLQQTLGSDHSKWSWGRLHTLDLQHPLGRVALLKPLFNPAVAPAHGALETVNTYSHHLIPGKKDVFMGAATRRLVDLGDEDATVSVIPGGQSGVPLDRHFNDQLPRYLDHEYRKAPLWSEPHPLNRLQLIPAASH